MIPNIENSMQSGKTRKDAGDETILARIDQYELIRELGGGGFGTVYLAKDTGSGVLAAVKGLPAVVRNDSDELENLKVNFALVHELYHPNIAAALVLHPVSSIAYYDESVHQKLRIEKGDLLMVMAYAPGTTLSKWRRQFPGRRVPMAQALEITRQIASALDYAHGQRIIHRDIKPANVMVETKPDGKLIVRVLDFGLAAEIRSSMSRVSREIHDTSGTRPYMAPEQWLGGRQGAATDQYSLAALFHELVTGEVPLKSVFDTGDPVVMQNAVGHNPVDIPDDLPPHVRTALTRALAKKPADRFASCSEFADALEGKNVPSRKSPPKEGTVGRRNLTAKAIVTLLLLSALAGGGGWWWVQGRHTTEPKKERTTPEEEARRIAAEHENEELKSEVLVMKGKAGQARDRNAKEEWHSWPHFDTRAKDVESLYRAGVEAFDKADYKLAKEMFAKVRENMRWLDSNKKWRIAAVDSRVRAESSKGDAQKHSAAQFASSYWQFATDAYGKATALFEEGEFEESGRMFDDAQRQFSCAAKQSVPREKEANWHVGSQHPHNPNLVADVRLDTWRSTRPGYVWVEGTDRDEWKVGVQHPENSKLKSDWQEGKWTPTEEGYVWTGGSHVEWRAGIVNSEHPHWVSIKTKEHPSGYWRPEPGYVKKDKDKEGLSDLVWKEGLIDGNRKSSSVEGVWLDRCSSCNGGGLRKCLTCDGTGWTSSRCNMCNNGYTHNTEVEICSDCLGGVRYEQCAFNCVQQIDGNRYIKCNCNDCIWLPNGAHGKQVGFMFQPCTKCGGQGLMMCPNRHVNGMVPVGKCLTCNGTLQKTVQKTVRCGLCDGTGKVKNSCPDCRSGNVRCRSCNGTGWK